MTKRIETGMIGPLRFGEAKMLPDLGLQVRRLESPDSLVGSEIKISGEVFQIVAIAIQGFRSDTPATLEVHTENPGEVEVMVPLAGAACLQTFRQVGGDALTHLLSGGSDRVRRLVDGRNFQLYLNLQRVGYPEVVLRAGDDKEVLLSVPPHVMGVVGAGLHHVASQIRLPSGHFRSARWLSLKVGKLG